MKKIHNIIYCIAFCGGFVPATAFMSDVEQASSKEPQLVQEQITNGIKQQVDKLAEEIMASIPEDRRRKIKFLNEITFFESHPFAPAFEAFLRSSVSELLIYELNSGMEHAEHLENEIIRQIFYKPTIFQNETKDPLQYALIFQLKDYLDKMGINDDLTDCDYIKLLDLMDDSLQEDFCLLAKIGEYCKESHNYQAFARNIKMVHNLQLIGTNTILGLRPCNDNIGEVDVVKFKSYQDGRGKLIQDYDQDKESLQQEKIVFELVKRVCEKYGISQDFSIKRKYKLNASGASGGLSDFFAMLSAVIKKQIPSDIAMTGQLFKNGVIFAVGIGGKIDVAVEFGCTRIMLSEYNRIDFEEWKERNPDSDVEAIFPKDVFAAIPYVFPELELKQSQDEGTEGEATTAQEAQE